MDDICILSKNVWSGWGKEQKNAGNGKMKKIGFSKYKNGVTRIIKQKSMQKYAKWRGKGRNGQ